MVQLNSKSLLIYFTFASTPSFRLPGWERKAAGVTFLSSTRYRKMTKKITFFIIKTSALKSSLYLIENETQTAVINNASFRILHKLDHVS